MTTPPQLRPHQVPHAQQLLIALRQFGAALDGSDTGTGKTFAALAVAKMLDLIPLVICPKSVVPAWQRAAASMDWACEAVGYEKARGVSTYYDHKGEYRARKTTSIYGSERKIGNGSQWVWDPAYELMIFDEVQRCSGMTSLSSKMLIAAKRQAKYVLCLSATAAERPEKMKALGYTLGLFCTADYQWWMMQHGVKPGHFGGFRFTTNIEKQQEVMTKLHGDLYPKRGARMIKGKIPGFPKTQISARLIPDTTGKAVRLMVDILELYLQRERQAADAEARQSILEQLIRKRQALELLKVSDLVELADDYSETSKVVVFCHFKDTLAALRESLPKANGMAPIIDGSNTAAEREAIKTAFQQNKIPILLCNAGAGGVGLDLHDPTGVVERTALISPGWSATQLKQVLGRVHRDGGAFSQQLLVGFGDTLEEDILARLEVGCRNIDTLNDGMMNGAL